MSVPAGYKVTEGGLIPEDWEAVPLGALFTFKNGLNKAKQFFGHGTPIVNYMDVYRFPALRMAMVAGRVDVNKVELDSYSVRRGDVFFTRTSETVEEVGIASAMLDDAIDTVFSGFVLRARPKSDDLVDHFKAYAFRSEAVRNQIVAKATYTTRALTNGGALSAISLAKPPKSEQSAIAEALSDVDEAIAAVEAAIAKKRALKTATMQALLSGTRRLPGFSGEWKMKTLGHCLMQKPSYGINAPAVPYDDKLPRYLRITDITADGHFSDRSPVSVSHPASANYYLSSGDLVFARTGASTGKCYRYRERDGNLVYAGFLIRVTPDPVNLNSAYLAAQVETQKFSKYVAEVSQRSGQPGINGKQLSAFKLPVPPTMAEQSAIAQVIEDMDNALEAFRAKLAKLRRLKTGMMQQLLTGKIRLA